MLTERCQKAPPSGELDATIGSRLRGFSRPLGEGGIALGDDERGDFHFFTPKS